MNERVEITPDGLFLYKVCPWQGWCDSHFILLRLQVARNMTAVVNLPSGVASTSGIAGMFGKQEQVLMAPRVLQMFHQPLFSSRFGNVASV